MNKKLERQKEEIYSVVEDVKAQWGDMFSNEEDFKRWLSVYGGPLFSKLDEETEKLFWLYPITDWFDLGE